MLMKNFKDTDSAVSALGLGCMRLPRVGPDSDKIDYEKAAELLDISLARGINYLDTAFMYHSGDSETFLGHALQKYERSSYYLATKMPIWMADTPADMERIFNLQLQRLQTDYIDFYLDHSLNKANFKRSVEFGLFDFLTRKKEEGRIRFVGFSFHDEPSLLETVCRAYPWDFAQLQLNYLDWELQDAKRQYEILEEHGLPCIVMEPVRGGALADLSAAANRLLLDARPDKSIASWAIRYAASLPNVLTVLSGMSNKQQLDDNIHTFTDFEPITPQDEAVLEKAVAAYKSKDTLPCTGCRYCMDCPFGVDIPEVFSLYNQYSIDRDTGEYRSAYLAMEEGKRADNCTACGNCATHCPQSIPIPEKMEMIRNLTKKLFA